MSAKKRRRAKEQKTDEIQEASAQGHMDFSNLSVIERASFMEGLQGLNSGNPLHSTAVEEDLNISGGQKKDGRRGVAKTSETRRGAAVKRKDTERDAESGEEEEKKRKRRSSAAREVKNQQVMKGERKAGSAESNAAESQTESDKSAAHRARKTILSSDEEVDEDTSWKPSQKKTRVYSLTRTRKSSPSFAESRRSSSDGVPEGSASASASASAEQADTETQKKRRKASGQRRTELEVVLDSFSDFCDQYRESVESKAVKQAIDSFSTNVKQQLMEKISANKELAVLKRENSKVGSLIRKKTQRLLDAKHEMMRAERQVFLLKKEKAELKLRLADLRQGQAFLQDLRELNRLYLACRQKHPDKRETYGESSLPALQLETKLLKAAEHRPKE